MHELLCFFLHFGVLGHEQSYAWATDPAVNIALAIFHRWEFEKSDLVLELLWNIRVGREVRQFPGAHQIHGSLFVHEFGFALIVGQPVEAFVEGIHIHQLLHLGSSLSESRIVKLAGAIDRLFQCIST
ncbi:hypothetical protein D3C74_429700 [compost metagenome]